MPRKTLLCPHLSLLATCLALASAAFTQVPNGHQFISTGGTRGIPPHRRQLASLVQVSV